MNNLSDIGLVLSNVTNGFYKEKNQPVVLQKNINVSLHEGEFVCLLGPNGAGKSTLLHTLSGFHHVLSGQISYFGKNLHHLTIKERSKQVALVLTDRIDDAWLTVWEIVSMGRFPYNGFTGKLTHNDISLVDNILKEMNIAHFKNKVFRVLSDGEKQKVLLARALTQETPFLFLDEPVAFVDSPGKIEIMEQLQDIAHRQNKGIIMTTHDIEIALDYADTIWLMNQNKPLISGIPESLVLNGDVNNYFDRNNVKFDKQTGRFSTVNTDPHKIICLKSDKESLMWLGKGFQRLGFMIRVEKYDDPFQSDYFDFIKDHFVYIKNNKIYRTFSNVKQALKFGKSLF